MYNSLKIKNLKTFKTDQVLKIAPITLIYGENSSGKTAILKSFDIIHNIFAEHRIRNQKTVDDKSNVFFSRMDNISANKIHFYSYQLNKKPINLELDLNLPFSAKQSTLLESEIKTRYSNSGSKSNFYHSPIKLDLNIRYSKVNKFSKVDNIKIKRLDNTELLNFNRLDKKNKPLNSGEIGYLRNSDKMWLRGYSRDPMGRPMRSFDSKQDYFLNENYYADYKIKSPNSKILWQDEYDTYKKIFLQEKDIIERRKFIRKLINLISIIKYSFDSSSYRSLVYYVAFKILDDKKLSLEKILNLKKIKEVDFNKPENLAKTIISDFKKNSDFIDLKEKNKISKLVSKAETKYNQDCIKFEFLSELKRKLTKKERKFSQIFLFCDNFRETFNANHLVLAKSLETSLPSKIFFITAENELTNRCLLRFYKRGPAINCSIIKSSGKRSYSTFDFLFLLSKYIIGDLNNCFWGENRNELPYLSSSTLSSNLIAKCINEIRRTIDNYIVCRPNTTNVPYSVPRETDLPEDFYSKEFEKWLKKTGRMRDERIRRQMDRTSIMYGSSRKHNNAHMIFANGANFDRIILEDPKLLKKLNISLKDLLDLEIVLVTPVFLRKIIKDPELYKRYLSYRPLGTAASKKRFIMLKDLKFKKTFTIHGDEVGKGPSNILPFIGQLLSDKAEMTYLIQELENNWHPKYQSKIIDLIVKNVKDSIKKTVILETHSELFILKIKKLVQKKIISHKDVSINFVKRQRDGSSEIINIPLNELGGFEKEWPGGFFKERMEILSS